jgi:hypothetical protein
MSFPATIRIEVKTTTSEAVPLPLRELAALDTKDSNEVGILAALFWCGDRDVDGRWLIADAAATFRQRTAQTISVPKTRMERAHRGQSWLDGLKQHITDVWPPFLQAFFEDAMRGHEALCEVLKHAHENGTVAARLPTERVLDTDHRDAIQSLIDHHGESPAGHIFQDLFAYLVGHAGYSTVTLNPVGVPDVTVSGLVGQESVVPADVDLGSFSERQARTLLKYCEQSGDEELADRVRQRLADAKRR